MTDSANVSHGGGGRAPGRGTDVASLVLPAAVALAVCLPFVEKGWLFLLDWQRGPHVPLPPSAWGLDGGLLAAVPFAVAAWAVGHVVDPSVVVWLPIVAALFAAGVAAASLVGGSALRRLPAGLLYAVNPLVFERLYAGQVAYLLAYALLPFAVGSLLRASHAHTLVGRLQPVLWITLLIGLAPHFAWVTAVVCLVLLATDHSRRALGWLAGLAVAVVVANAYLLLSALVGGRAAVDVGAADLAAYRTSGDPRLGLFGNVAGLHGFWRSELALPKDDVPGWPLFWAAVVLVAAAGAVRAWRAGGGDRRLAVVVGGAGALGLLLALGDQGPAGAAYRWLFENLPGFEVMREPQKFAALLALAYAVLFGLGAEALVAGARGRMSRRAWAAAALVLPIAATPTLFWGLGGRVEVSRYPASWAEADRIMGDGAERILFLPWHQYLSFPFTERIVANPAPFAFRRDVIAGDNVELPGIPTASRSTRSAYLEFLFDQGSQLHAFGQLVAPHGVRFVVVAKTVDWEQYRWLDAQRDLEKVLDRAEIAVYRSTVPVVAAARVPVAVTVADWGEYAGLSEVADLSGAAVRVRREAPGRVRSPAVVPTIPSGTVAVAAAERRSPVRYRLSAGEPGWLVLGERFDRSWRAGGREPVRLAGGVTGFEVGAAPLDIRFGHWSVVRASYAVSIAAVAFVALAGLGARRKGKNERFARGPRPMSRPG